MKIGKYGIGRDPFGRFSIRWLDTTGMDDEACLSIGYRSIPAYPPQYGTVLAITPKAIAEEPGVIVKAFGYALRSAQETHKLLKSKGKRGLRFETLEFHLTPPVRVPETPTDDGPDDENTLIAWKAYAR